jgi:hypothetical protein
MDSSLMQAVAREVLGLDLTEAEAAALVQPYLGLQRLLRTLEEVPLPFSQDPFISPGTGDQWLDAWPEP